MIIESIATAGSVEQAKDLAIANLCAPDGADVEFEIIDLPSKKTLGLFGGKDAKVRAYYDDGKEEVKVEEAPIKKEAPKKSAKKQRAVAKANDRTVKKTADYIRDVVNCMEVGDVEVEVSDVEDGFCITLLNGDIGNIIGSRGKTLDSLQYLASLCCNNDAEGFTRVVVDCNNYREKREKTLYELATRVANTAKENNKCQSLEPMNPYERRVIHTAVGEIEGISSWSVSDGAERRVIIGPAEMEGQNPPRYSKRDRGSRRKNDRGRRDRRPSQKVDAVPTREKMSDSVDAPLFGRIN